MIEVRLRTVFYAPTARRHYQTRKAAVMAEARALVKRHYPSQREHHDDMGRLEDPGFHWLDEPQAVRLHARLVRIIDRKSRAAS